MELEKKNVINIIIHNSYTHLLQWKKRMDEQVGLGQLKRGATVRTKPEAEADGADLATVPYTSLFGIMNE